MNTKVVNQKIRDIANNFQDKIELGVHFHRKTQNMSEWRYQYELEHMIEDDVWPLFSLVNIGGGVPSTYANTNEKVIAGILNTIGELKEWLHEKNCKLILEPGRAIAAPAGKLITTIKAIYDNTIIIDASVYNADMDALIVPVKLLVENEVSKEEGKPYIIKGETPCSLDLFRYRVYLKDPKQGDELVFLNAGAYNFTTDFVDLEKIQTVIE